MKPSSTAGSTHYSRDPPRCPRSSIKRMHWSDRHPPATDPLLHMLIPYGGSGDPVAWKSTTSCQTADTGRRPGVLLEALELCRTPDLEPLLRHAYRLDVPPQRSRSAGRTATTERQSWTAADPTAAAAASRPAHSANARRRNRAPSGVATGVIGWRFWPIKLRPGGRLAQWLLTDLHSRPARA